MSVAAWLGPGGLFARNVTGFAPREAQLSMAHAVERALHADETLLIEAGTGTGKTLAYLVPAILSGKKVVISTGTKTLQDQIVQRDLPLIERVQQQPVAAVCMKGLSNYLCLRRYEEYRRGPEAAFGPYAKQLPVLERWRETTVSGDRAELTEFALDAPLWHEVQSSSETRIGPKCVHFNPCFVTKMRKEADSARILIVNHHLYFADLAMRGPHGGGVIPDHDAVIFDEAHAIEDIATDFFGVSVSTAKIELLVRDAQRAFVAAGLFAKSERLTSAVALTAARFFETLPRPKAGESGRVPLPPETFVIRLQEPMFALDNALDALARCAALEQAESEAIAQIARRTEQIRNELSLIAEGGGGGHVTWTIARGRSVSIGSSPVEIANVLRDKLFMRGGACVLTSATLSTGDSFEYVKARLGIDFDVGETSLVSPFDYPQQAALYLPRGLGDPRDPQFSARAAREIVELCRLTSGGAFVLCTSLRAMRELAELCRASLPYRTLVQGSAPNAALLDAFRADGDAVLFATAGFWHGVDVPGQALRLVIIDKLPFDVPSDPLVSARCHRLKERGEEPFMRYLVPSAALTLKQGFGRLIRTRSDRGIVAILDERVSTKGYGKVFLRSLPPARRCQTIVELRAFWERASEPARASST